MTMPVLVHLPADAGHALPFICDSPHSGVSYPADFGHAIERAALRQSEDTHVDALWSRVPAAGGTLLCATFPRSYIDANRDEADLDPSMIDGPWAHPARPSERTLELGMGLVWRDTPQRRPIYDRRLTVAEVEHRIETCWQPYRRTLAETLDRAARRFGAYWHLNLHSMPSNAYERLAMPRTQALADVVLGDRHGTTCGGEFTAVVTEAFRAQGLRVALNDPYEGADLVRTAGEPARGRHSLQIELNRALYMHEPSREPSEGYVALKTALDAVVDTLAGYVRSAALHLPARVGACTAVSASSPPSPSWPP
jgi:N-formylglutamate deformylase